MTGFFQQLKGDLRMYGRVAVDILQYYCVVQVIEEHLANIEMCVGPSMMPTLEKDGAVVILDQVSPKMGWIKRGDIVISRSPFDVRHDVCKRVTGMPGDIIDQPPAGPGKPGKITIVPPGHLWLQGDNLDNSRDSRIYGPVPQALVRGKVVYQIWPLHQHGPMASRPLPQSTPSRWGGKFYGPSGGS